MVPLVKQLMPSSLSLPTTLSSSGQITLCRLIPCAVRGKWVNVTTSDSSMLAPDCMKWTSGDQCKVMCAADYTSSAGTLTGTRDDGNGSVAIIGVLPNCPAALCAIDGIPSGTSHDCDGIAFLESCFANCSDGYAPVDVTSATLSCGFNGVLVLLAKPCLARAVRSWTTTPWRARIDPP